MSTETDTGRPVLEYVKTIGITNAAFNGRGFNNPCDTAVSSDGRIFVLNRCDPQRATAVRIGICNLEEEYLGEFSNGYGSEDGQLMLPVALAFDSKDRLHITDEYNHRVTVYDSSGKFLYQWGQFGGDDGQLNGPAGIAIDADDNVYLADQHNHRVQKFDSRGGYLLGWGEFGSGEGQLNMPWGVTTDTNGDVYVADWRNDRIQKFAPDGRFLTKFGASGDGDGQFNRPSSVAVDSKGYVYVADWANQRVQVLGPDGSFQLKLRGQATPSKWAQEYLDVNPEEKQERERSNLIPELPPHLDTPYLVSSQTEPYFWGPVSVKLDRGGRLYVTEPPRHRFQVYRQL